MLIMLIIGLVICAICVIIAAFLPKDRDLK